MDTINSTDIFTQCLFYFYVENRISMLVYGFASSIYAVGAVKNVAL